VEENSNGPGIRTPCKDFLSHASCDMFPLLMLCVTALSPLERGLERQVSKYPIVAVPKHSRAAKARQRWRPALDGGGEASVRASSLPPPLPAFLKLTADFISLCFRLVLGYERYSMTLNKWMRIKQDPELGEIVSADMFKCAQICRDVIFLCCVALPLLSSFSGDRRGG
jgi:hypothetical protein